MNDESSHDSRRIIPDQVEGRTIVDVISVMSDKAWRQGFTVGVFCGGAVVIIVLAVKTLIEGWL